MTTVDPRTVAEINTIETPCQMRGADWTSCPDPAAWLVTWTARHSDRPFIAHIPTCIDHMAAVEQHRSGCVSCRDAFDITQAEL